MKRSARSNPVYHRKQKTMDYRNQQNLPRGIRNNNPGNIKADGTSWQGMAGDDGTFVIFDDMSWGTRAMATSLTNMVKGGLTTLNQLIRTWSATDQDAYVANVSQATGIDPNAPLSLDVPTLSKIMRAMISQENGDAGSLVSDQDISDGISKANNSILSFLQAGAATVVDNPGTSTALILGLIVAGYLIFRKR